MGTEQTDAFLPVGSQSKASRARTKIAAWTIGALAIAPTIVHETFVYICVCAKNWSQFNRT